MTKDKLNVFVTSRAAEDNALWLLNHLRSHPYRGLLGNVTYLSISNRNQKEWREEVDKSSSAILYHTAKHGRINVTDVTDSLYDTELQHLSKTLGREHVLVVLDDLQKSDNEERDRILKSQPSISRLASHLLLFTNKEKAPVPEAKQKILLDTCRAAQKEDQVSHVQWKTIIMSGVGVGFVLAAMFLFKRCRRPKGSL
ncbi:uncharacterized protein O3C94_018448 [Discoglossus pictus]